MTLQKKPILHSHQHSALIQFTKSVWLFPAILSVILLLLTACHISGSSIGTYHQLLYGGTPDSHLLANRPQPIRSDEWLVTTQLTVAQAAAGYPRINTNIDTGRDMSVITDVPYKEWSVAFKPQNLAFFVLPLEYAFAFKWWLLLYLTILGCYFFTFRQLRLKRYGRLFATLFSMGVGCSPFLFWWYQTITLAPMFYGFFILLIGMRIIDDQPLSVLRDRSIWLSRSLSIVGLGYLLTAFTLVLYPPFQIPVALAVGAYLTGYYLESYSPRQIFNHKSLTTLARLSIALLIAGAIVGVFISTRSGVINAINSTVYPGKRVVLAGGTQIQEVFSSYMQPQLQRAARGAHYYSNQSEASSFILFLPFLLIPSLLAIVAEYRHSGTIRWRLITVGLCALVFFTQMFIPGLDPVYKFLLLDKVPHTRLFIGLGFVGVLQLLLVLSYLLDTKVAKLPLNIMSGIYLALCAVPLAWAGLYTRSHYPLFIHSEILIGLMGFVFCLTLFCFLTKKMLLGASLFLVFSAGSVYQIHPLYRGLASIQNGPVIQAIQRVSKPNDTWVTVDNIYLENFPVLANRPSLSGVQPYPKLAFWRQLDGPSKDAVYNRYAHVLFNSDPAFTDDIKLIQFDSFQVQFACTPFVEKHVQFALASHAVSNSCTSLVSTIKYPALTLYIYRVN